MMKRINPKTGVPFKRGDEDEKGNCFCYYKTGFVRKDGTFSENWLPKNKYLIWASKQIKRNESNNILNKLSDWPKRINPQTGVFFKVGDLREDGKYFLNYNSNGKTKGGFRGEGWGDYNSLIKYRISTWISRTKKRAKDKNIIFNLSASYLFSIYPSDGKCPILNIYMKFGNDEYDNSPSIDRIIPEKGYTVDNVQWVSRIANMLKSDRTSKELRQIADWIEKQPIWINKYEI